VTERRSNSCDSPAPAPPDILLVAHAFPPAIGGSGELLENVYSRIEGPNVTVLTDAACVPERHSQRGRMQLERARLDSRSWGVLEWRSLAQHIRLARRINGLSRRRPTIVHCGRAQPEGVAALIARRFPPFTPYVFWVHGEEITVAQTSRDFDWTMRRVHAGAALAITNSHNSARTLTSVGFDPRLIRVVYPGVDSERFQPDVDGSDLRARFAVAPGELLLSVGRLQRRKGHDLVMRAMHALRSDLPNLVYVIVGDGAERQPLELLARELGIARRVSFEGEVTREQLPSYYAAADIFVLPTRVDVRDFEGFGLVFLEAAAAGKPTIGGRTGGVPEAVADGESGLLVDPSDESDLARAIRTLVLSRDLRTRFGLDGRRRVVQQFTWDRAAREVLTIHAEVAPPRGRADSR
jgi:phosphatidyl-myo-inositol dimannoside synthase